MFGRRRKFKKVNVDRASTNTIIGPQTELHGDVRFSARLHVEGIVKGNILAEDDSQSVLTVTSQGTIEGEVRVPNVVLDGTVIGDVYAKDFIELKSNARITGNVYYGLIEMAMGAELNGNLVHHPQEQDVPLKLGHGVSLEVAEES